MPLEMLRIKLNSQQITSKIQFQEWLIKNAKIPWQQIQLVHYINPTQTPAFVLKERALNRCISTVQKDTCKQKDDILPRKKHRTSQTTYSPFNNSFTILLPTQISTSFLILSAKQQNPSTPKNNNQEVAVWKIPLPQIKINDFKKSVV